jgi:carbon monoxide dehydrogenase subunit G
MRVRETMQVRRPRGEVFAALMEPEDHARPAGWRSLARSGDGYEGVLHAAAGPIEVDFDCRFEVAEAVPGEQVQIRGTGVSPRLGFTVDVRFSLRGTDDTTTVELDAEVAAAGELAGLGQRRLAEQARRLLTAYVAA